MVPSLLAVLAFAGISLSQEPVRDLVSRRLTEYLLPITTQTHEIAHVPGSKFLLVSQMSNSHLVKIEIDPATEQPMAYQSFPMGQSNESGLHGLWTSTAFPGKVWTSLQRENKLLLIDPGHTTLSDKPTILRTVDIPEPGNGPHCVFEINGRLWAGLKDPSPSTGKYYAFSASLSNTSDGTLYETLPSPVFIQQYPGTDLIYVTQDTASSIMRIDLSSGKTSQIAIPTSVGVNPVGMTTVATGPLKGLWFTLAGNATGGTGTFGRITESGELQFFKLKTPWVAAAGLLHLADASTEDGGPALWLLATSLLSAASPDALIWVGFDDKGVDVVGEEAVALGSQGSWAHRVVVLEKTVVATELGAFTLAQLGYKGTAAGRWLPAVMGSG